MSVEPKVRGDTGFRFYWDRMLVESGASIGARAFAQAIRLEMNDSGVRWIEQSTILARIPKSKRTVQRYRAELEAAGFLECSEAHRRKTNFKKGESVIGGCTTYTLTVPSQRTLWLPTSSLATIEAGEVAAELDDHTVTQSAKSGRAPSVSPIPTERVTEVSPESVERVSPATPPTSPVYPVLVSDPVLAVPTAPPRREPRPKAARASAEDVATWLNDVFRQLHPQAYEAFEHDWMIKLHEKPGKRDQVINAVRAISDRPAALGRLRDVILGDWEVRNWSDFEKGRRTESLVVSQPDGSAYETVRCTWNNVAQLMLDRIYGELPQLRRYPTHPGTTARKRTSLGQTPVDIDALATAMASKVKLARPVAA